MSNEKEKQTSKTTDDQIIDMYCHRDENAIAETDIKYGGMLYTIGGAEGASCQVSEITAAACPKGGTPLLKKHKNLKLLLQDGGYAGKMVVIRGF